MITALGNTDQCHYGDIFSVLAHSAVGYKPTGKLKVWDRRSKEKKLGPIG